MLSVSDGDGDYPANIYKMQFQDQSYITQPQAINNYM
jgi:hypothetical protein